MNSLLDRRQFLTRTTTGLSSIALASLLHQNHLLADANPQRPQIDPAHPFAARKTHHDPAARNVL
ncbi:MAG: DUF1501 domain-containing protein, partial [Planctomycetaceae bacterium]|nr:DUF1501 domain-containing protein [Planctomycetaceae bacterium]